MVAQRPSRSLLSIHEYFETAWQYLSLIASEQHRRCCNSPHNLFRTTKFVQEAQGYTLRTTRPLGATADEQGRNTVVFVQAVQQLNAVATRAEIHIQKGKINRFLLDQPEPRIDGRCRPARPLRAQPPQGHPPPQMR